MNEDEAKKKIRALKAFYRHLLMYAVFMVGLAIVNFTTYMNGDREIWVIYPLVFWGATVLLQGLAVHGRLGNIKQWEERKFRELTGWNATKEELVRLTQRVDTLLKIVSLDSDDELTPELVDVRAQLLEAKGALERYQSPLDRSGETSLKMRDVVDLIERLEAVVTSRAFRHFDSAMARSNAAPPSSANS